MIHDPGTKNNVQNQVANFIRGQTGTFEEESDTCDGEVRSRSRWTSRRRMGACGEWSCDQWKSLNAVILRQEFILYYSPCMYICVCMCMCVWMCMYLTYYMRNDLFCWVWGTTVIFMGFCRYILRDTAFQCMHHSLTMLQCIAAVIFDTPEHTILSIQKKINPYIKIYPKRTFGSHSQSWRGWPIRLPEELSFIQRQANFDRQFKITPAQYKTNSKQDLRSQRE